MLQWADWYLPPPPPFCCCCCCCCCCILLKISLSLLMLLLLLLSMPRYGITLLLKVIRHRIAIIQSLQICRQSVLIWITYLCNVYGIPIVTTRPTLYVMPKFCELNFRELMCCWYINQHGTSIVLPQATRTSTIKKLKQLMTEIRIKLRQACWRHFESTLIPLDEENSPISGIKIF